MAGRREISSYKTRPTKRAATVLEVSAFNWHFVQRGFRFSTSQAETRPDYVPLTRAATPPTASFTVRLQNN